MTSTCILTDGTAQCLGNSFRGSELVSVVPYQASVNEHTWGDARSLKLAAIPATVKTGPPQILPPSAEDFRHALVALGRKFHEIVVVLPSPQLGQACRNAKEAVDTVKCGASVHLVDSENTAVGLGLLVQVAAEAAVNGLNGMTISRLLRGLAPHIYSLFCVQSLTYLAQVGILDPAQAIVGEMLGVTPFFVLESGRLTPIQKARSPRHLLDTLFEFVSEFDQVRHIAIIEGISPFDQEGRALRERLNNAAPVSEHTLTAPVAATLGPRCLGVVVMEDVPELNGYLSKS